MTDEQRELIINSIKEQILEYAKSCKPTDEEIRAKTEEFVFSNPQCAYIRTTEKIEIIERVVSSIRGYGVLDEIIADPDITEVMINGPDDIFIEKKGRLYKLDKKFESRQRLEDIVQRIVGTAGREVNQSNPIVDTRLADGSRVNVVLPPIALNGPIVTIRRFSKEPMTFEKLMDGQSVPIFKTTDTWTCKPSGVLNTVKKEAINTLPCRSLPPIKNTSCRQKVFFIGGGEG